MYFTTILLQCYRMMWLWKLLLKVKVNKNSACKKYMKTTWHAFPDAQQTKSLSLLIMVRSNFSQSVRRVMNSRTQFWQRRPQI